MSEYSKSARGSASTAQAFSQAAALLVMLIGFLVLLGWLFDVDALKSAYAGITMKANTALSLVLLGISLLTLNRDPGFVAGAGRFCAALVVVIGFVTLSEHITGVNLHIDQILFVESPGALATASPGRMGITAASCFILSGVALLLFYRKRSVSFPQILSIMVGLWAMLSIIGYAYHAAELYGIAPYSGIALQTAVAFLILSFGLLAARLDRGFISILRAQDAGGMMARRLLFTVLTVPFTLGWLLLLLQRAGYADAGFALAILVVSLTIILAGVVWHGARQVSYLQAGQAAEMIDRKRAEHSVIKHSAEQAALYELTDRLHRAESLNDVYDSALDATFSALACDRAALLFFDTAGVMRFTAWRGLSDEYRQAVEGEAPWKPEQANAQPIYFNDTNDAELDESLKAIVKQEGIRALIFIPLTVRGKLIGSFMAYYNAPHSFNDQELLLANTIARQLIFGVERKRDEEERRKTDRAQALLAEIVESSEDAIISKTLQGIILSWNSAAQRLFGYTADEAIGKSITIIIPHERLDEERFILERLQLGERIEHFETLRVAKSGQPVNISLTVSPVRDRDGNVVGASKIARDISQRLRDEAALREREERFRTLADASPFLVWMAGTDKRCHYFNQRWLTFTGQSMEDEVENGWAKTIHPADQQRCQDVYTSAFDARQDFEIEYRRQRHGGEYRWILDHGVPLFASPDVFVGYVGACLDITERKVIEKEREQLLKITQAARAEAEAANRIKDEFLATLSHELRTPLNAIMGWSSMLLNNKMNEETVARALETVNRNAQVQAKLIDDILDVSRIVAGNVRLESRPVELIGVIEAAIDVVRPAAEARSIGISKILDRSTGPVLGDANRLQQIVWNLLSNAVKFTPPGGSVTIQLKTVDSQVELIVSDNGEGISEEFLPYVFDRFRQADGTLTRSQKGLGLGLAIVRNLVELQGGTVSAQSDGAGKGSAFKVSLPLLSSGAKVLVPEGQTADPARQRTYARLALAGLRVLVIDDEPDAREMLITMLSDCEAHVKSAGSAAQALLLLTDWQPDVLISDIQMPETDGYTFIRQLRAREAERGVYVPAVALTAHSKAEDRLCALEAGYQMHISKPVDLTELALAVATLAGRGEAEKAAGRRPESMQYKIGS